MNSFTTNEVSQRNQIFEPANKRLESKRESEFSKFIKDEDNQPAARKERHSKSADEKPNDEFRSETESDPRVKDQNIKSQNLSDEPTDEAVENHFRLQLGLHEPVDDVTKLDDDLAILALPQSNPDSANDLSTIRETGFPSELATDEAIPAPIIPESEISEEEINQATFIDPLTALDSKNDVPSPDFLLTELSDAENFVPPADSESTQSAADQSVLPVPLDLTQDTAEPVIQATDLSQTILNANAVSATVSESIADEIKPLEKKLETSSSFSGPSRGQQLAPVETHPSVEFEGEVLPLDGTAELVDSNSDDNPWIEPNKSTTDQPSSSTNPLIDGIGARPAEASTSKPHMPYSPEVVKNITQTVTENLVQEAKFSDNGSNKQLIVQLHPAELGQVVLQVDWDNDVLKAKIVASEMAASEILNQQKPHLVSALAESGLNFDSLDIAFKNTPHDQQESNRSQGSSEPSVHQDDAEPQTPTTNIHLNNPSESRIDLVA